MALFTVLESADGNADRTVFVKEGFSVAAALFTVLWALWHRMWVVSALLFVILAGIIVGMGQLGLSGLAGNLLETALGLIFGFEARALLISLLLRSGYREDGIYEASSREAAELMYFAGKSKPVALQPQAKFTMTADDTLGLFGTP